MILTDIERSEYFMNAFNENVYQKCAVFIAVELIQTVVIGFKIIVFLPISKVCDTRLLINLARAFMICFLKFIHGNQSQDLLCNF
jgi:hypothetical protein